MTKCPLCFGALADDIIVFECVGSCDPIPDTRFSELYGAARTSKPLTIAQRPSDPKEARRWTPPSTCACRCCEGPTTEVCRNCHYVLPPGWRLGQATCIALAGARTTGKSVYIGVLVRYLEGMVEELGSVLAPWGQTSSIYAERYEKDLFIARKMLPSTATLKTQDSHQREPLIYSLGRIKGARSEHFLVLRDVAGEDLEFNASESYLTFLRGASLVLYLFDPTQVSEIKHELSGQLNEQTVGKGDPKVVWQNVLTLATQGSGLLGVAMAKFDNLQAIGRNAVGGHRTGSSSTAWPERLANPGAAFNREPASDVRRYDEADGRLLHQEVRSLLMACNALGMVNALENPPQGRPITHRFFAVSALGAQPDYEGSSSRGIAPYRILDPIRWVLAREGVIGDGKR